LFIYLFIYYFLLIYLLVGSRVQLGTGRTPTKVYQGTKDVIKGKGKARQATIDEFAVWPDQSTSQLSMDLSV